MLKWEKTICVLNKTRVCFGLIPGTPGRLSGELTQNYSGSEYKCLLCIKQQILFSKSIVPVVKKH